MLTTTPLPLSQLPGGPLGPYGDPRANGAWAAQQRQHVWTPSQKVEDSTSRFYGDAEELVATPLPSHLRFISASASRQHHLKAEAGMIDADVVEEAPSFLGICDGVSEVQTLGISPDEFPRELLQRTREALDERSARQANEAIDRSWPSSAGPQDQSWIREIIQDAYKETETEGSTTLLMAVIEEANRLLIANLGDCCLLVLRRVPSQPQKLHIAFKTEPLRFEHNKPFQVARLQGIPTEQIIAVINSARVDYFPAQHGDMLILGTDGVFDNLHDEDVVRIVENTCPWTPPRQSYKTQIPRQQQQPVWGSALQNLMAVPSVAQLGGAADAIVQEALNSVCVSKVDEATGQVKWPPGARQTPSGLGGKPDDTTVIVAAIVEVNDPIAHEDVFYKAHPSAKRPGGWFGNACCGGWPMKRDTSLLSTSTGMALGAVGPNGSSSDGCRCS